MGVVAHRETARLVGQFLDELGRRPDLAWLAIYRALLWYDDVGGSRLPHVMEVSALRGGAWRSRAENVHAYLAKALGVPSDQVASRVDALLSTPHFRGRQRQNPLGQGFAAALECVLSHLGATEVQYRKEVPSTDLFPGTRIPGRSQVPKIDLVGLRDERPTAIISVKWSLRHDRLSDITNECPVYKEAAYRLFRVRLPYYLVTNEFGPARLRRLLEDPCLDAVVHVHKQLVTEVCALGRGVENLADLSDLIAKTYEW